MISTGYQEIPRAEWPAVMAQYSTAWQDPEIPQRQYEMCVKQELDKWRAGISVVPYDALIRVLKILPEHLNSPSTSLLDIGASSGYYLDVIRTAGFWYAYTAVDFSEAFKKHAQALHPSMEFHLANACSLPFGDSEFPIVMSGACLMHVANYEKAIAEAVRVSSRYVIFHRTPITERPETILFVKEAYSIFCFELHFAEWELYKLFGKYGLSLVNQTDVFWVDGEMGHRTYLLSKDQTFHIQA